MGNNELSGLISEIRILIKHVEFINTYFENNFQGMIDYAIANSKARSICWDDWQENMTKISVIQNEIDDKAVLYKPFTDQIENYGKCLLEVDKKFQENIGNISKEMYVNIERLLNMFQFVYESDGGVGLVNDYVPCCILNLHDRYNEIAETAQCIIQSFIVGNNKNDSNNIEKDLMWCFATIQGNITFYANSLRQAGQQHDIEDARNRQMRDLLNAKGYDITDQSQNGISPNGTNPGEVDLLIKKDKMPNTYLEGLNQTTYNGAKILEHINKIFDYDSLGVAVDIVMVYYDGDDLKEFSDKYFNTISNGDNFTKFELQSSKTVESGYAEIKKFCSTFNRDGTEVKIMHYIVKINRK